MDPNTWALLGIHMMSDQTHATHARVRFCLADGSHRDEDVVLPQLPRTMVLSSELYADIMAPALNAMLAEFNKALPEPRVE